MTHPIEKYVDLENNPYLIARITVNQIKEDFILDVDIIYRESHKIFKHIDSIFNIQSSEEAIILGVQRLRKFLDDIEKDQNTNNNCH